jgi:hypothetical protein
MKGNNNIEILNSNVQNLFYFGTQYIFLLQNSSHLVMGFVLWLFVFVWYSEFLK